MDLTARLRSDIFRQLASDRGGSVQIRGSLVDLVVDRWVSGHRIDQNEPYPTVHGPRACRFKQWGGVQGSHVSLKEKARTGRASERRCGGVGFNGYRGPMRPRVVPAMWNS